MVKTKILKRFCLFAIASLFSIWGIIAQQMTVQGTIVDEIDSPLIGATVFEVGTSNGVATDMNGKYELKVNANSSLKITYVGYLSQELPVKAQSIINVKLLPDDNLILDEVVVVGYGTQKKVNLTGAVNSVKMEDVIGSRPVGTIT